MPLFYQWAASFTLFVVAGEIDTIEILQGRNIDDVIDVIKTEAIAKAIKFGANPGMCFSTFSTPQRLSTDSRVCTSR